MRVQRLTIQNKDKEKKASGIDIELINPLLVRYKKKKGNLIPLLQGAQEIYGYIPEIVFRKIAKDTGHKLSAMYGVATFYAQFRFEPVGKHIVKVCQGTACHVQNAKSITTALEETLKIKEGNTSKDKLFTLESVACLGCCSLAPVMMIGDKTHGKLSGKSASKIIRQIKRTEKKKIS